jgi:hypothetical protein
MVSLVSQNREGKHEEEREVDVLSMFEMCEWCNVKEVMKN